MNKGILNRLMRRKKLARLKRVVLFGAAGGCAALAANLALYGRSEASVEDGVVLITGGSRGLGLALARRYARAGYRVAICARNQSGLDAARRLLAAEGLEVYTVVCDVSDEAAVKQMIRDVESRWAPIDILINNAGAIRVAPLDNLTTADFEDAMKTMFWGVLYPTLHVLEGMKRRGKGRIATVTSIGGKVSVPHLLPYCCAKFAAVGLCEGLRAEAGRHGVKVITIAPGLMRTGSYRAAEFKGQQRAEAAWFSVAASLPLLSMDVDRAAQQIVRAIRRGRAETILSPQAMLLARLNGAVPGLMADTLGVINRLLPKGTADRESILTGAEAEAGSGQVLRSLIALGRRAAERGNEPAVNAL